MSDLVHWPYPYAALWRLLGSRAAVAAAAVLVTLAAPGCSGRGPGAARTAPVPAAPESVVVQQLYESGRYAEVVSRVSAVPAGETEPESLWLAAHSRLRLGQTDDARMLLAELAAAGAAPAWQVTSRLALAGLAGDAGAADRARQEAGAHPDDPFVQYELGLARARSGDFAAAADAFERTIVSSPRFAYAYYYAGLAYDRLDRADRMGNRFETFVRLAPEAPERPEVESILRTLRGR